MKCAFNRSGVVDELDTSPSVDHDELPSDDEEYDNGSGFDGLGHWIPATPTELQYYEGWIGCSAHQLQLVVNDGYKELAHYRRVQAVFKKAKAISALSRKSSHFANALSLRIPMANETRWNSYLRLHEHILSHADNINAAVTKVERQELILSTADKEELKPIVEVMKYFAEATDILQAENKPTSNRVIPVIDSLENFLKRTKRSTTAVNALCERLLHGLEQRFSYLLQSAVHQAATALDPQVNLSFTDHSSDNKVFLFSSSDVRHHVKSSLALPSIHVPTHCAARSSSIESGATSKLMDFNSISMSPCNLTETEIELQAYFDQSPLAVDPILYWAERAKTPLSTLALQLLSIPSSSAPAERLFSKAGIILNQRQTQLSSSKLEQLLFFK